MKNNSVEAEVIILVVVDLVTDLVVDLVVDSVVNSHYIQPLLLH